MQVTDDIVERLAVFKWNRIREIDQLRRTQAGRCTWDDALDVYKQDELAEARVELEAALVSCDE